MNINRRTVLKNFLVISAGMVLIPGCRQKGKPSIDLKNIDISESDEELLAAVCDTFIPTTDSPGAREIGAQLFVLTMLDDCTPEAVQQQVVRGFKDINEMAGKRFDADFIKCTAAQRNELFTHIEGRHGVSEDLTAFYHVVKKLTIQAYTTSKYY